jgi:pimeloyl-ACP methyl ester carboxylesterase
MIPWPWPSRRRPRTFRAVSVMSGEKAQASSVLNTIGVRAMPTLSEFDKRLLSQEIPELKTAYIASPLYAGGSGRLEYRMTGRSNAPTLFLMHGLGSSSAGYRAQLAGLADAFHVIAWDAPGFGASTPLATSDPDVEDYVEVLGVFLASLKVDRLAALIGSSWGSVIAVAFAARRPEIVGSLVLSGANTARGKLTGAERESEMAMRLSTADTSISVARSVVADRLLTPDTSVDVRRHVEKLRDSLTTVGWRQAIKILFTVHTPDLIGSVKCPVAMLAGSLDKIAPYEFHAQHLMASAPSAEFHLFDGYGHMLKLEAPSRFNEIIRTMAVNAASPPCG